MKVRITYHNDSKSRKGCHRVTMAYDKGTWKGTESTIFLIDEPGAWWVDEWNCHVDGQDFQFKTREECIAWGLFVLGYLTYEEEEEVKAKETGEK